MPSPFTLAVLDEWYFRNLPADGSWGNWERNSPSPGERNDTSGEAFGYAWTSESGCLTILGILADDRVTLRLVKSNAYLCLQ